VAYAQMMDVARPNRDRQEYPKVSYSLIGAIVTGTMGITVIPMPPKAPEEGGFVDWIVKTLPGLGISLGPNSVTCQSGPMKLQLVRKGGKQCSPMRGDHR